MDNIYDGINTPSIKFTEEDLNFTSIYDLQTLKSTDKSPHSEREEHQEPKVRQVRYLNLEKRADAKKAGMVIKPIISSNLQTHTKIIPDQWQKDFSSVLLPSFQNSKANLFKNQLLNHTRTHLPAETMKDKKGIRHQRHISPLMEKEASKFMQQSQRTNLMWTTAPVQPKFQANRTQNSMKTTQADDSTTLGLFPAKFRSKSIKPNQVRLLNDRSNDQSIEIASPHPLKTSQSPYHLIVSQTQSSAFYKPKASLERYQAIFNPSNLHGFETQRQLKMKQLVKDFEVHAPVRIDPSLVPESLQKTLLVGYNPQNQLLSPACFCQKNEICNLHNDSAPQIDKMLDLIDNQIEMLLQDELAMSENLTMIQKTNEILTTSRKDTFKETLMVEYRERQDEIHNLESRVAQMSLQEHQHVKITHERDTYQKQLQTAIRQMDRFGGEILTQAQMSKQEIEDLTKGQISVTNQLLSAKTELQRVAQESKNKAKQIEKAKLKLKEQEELLIDLNTENARITRENDTFRRFFVLNNAMLVTHKDDPAYIRQQIDEIFKDFGKAVNNSGTFIKDGIEEIEQVVNDKLRNQNKALDFILHENKPLDYILHGVESDGEEVKE